MRSFLRFAEHGTLDSVAVVKTGTRGHVGCVHTAARCAHGGRGAYWWPRMSSGEVLGIAGFRDKLEGVGPRRVFALHTTHIGP